MTMFRSRSPVKSVMLSMFAVALATCTMLGSSQQANAGTIKVYVDSGSGYVAAGTGDTGTFNFGSGNLVELKWNVTQTVNPADLLSSSIQITNSTGAALSNIKVFVATDGFSGPTIPPSPAILMNSNATVGSGTTVGGSNYLALTSSVDPGNTLNATTGSISPIGNQVWNATLVFGNVLNDNGVFLTPVANPFAIHQEVTFGTINAAARVNVSAQTTLTAVPEPTSMTLLGVGLVGMAGYGWRKRRQQLTKTVS